MGPIKRRHAWTSSFGLTLVMLLLSTCKPNESQTRRPAAQPTPVPAPVPVPVPDPGIGGGGQDAAALLAQKLWLAAKSVTLSLTGPVEGKKCLKLSDPGNSAAWEKVHLCWVGEELELSLVHKQSETSGKTCVLFNDPEASGDWSQTYLCQPAAKAACLRFVDTQEGATAPADLQCISLAMEEIEPGLTDNYLCTTQTQSATCPAIADDEEPTDGTGGPFEEIGSISWINDGATDPQKYCIQIVEGSDTHANWRDNYLCFDKQIDVQWSKAGAINGRSCIPFGDSSEGPYWADNFLCFQDDAYCLRYSDKGAINKMDCTQLAADPKPQDGSPAKDAPWEDNYLCKPKAPHGCPAGAPGQGTPTFDLLPGLSWDFTDPRPAGKYCIRFLEPGDPTVHAWHDNYLCMDAAPAVAITYSSDGARSGFCTQLKESDTVNPHSDLWKDNYLCAADDRYCLRWSNAGPIADMDCLLVNEPSEPTENSWHDNYLCIKRKADGHCPGK